MDLARIQQVDEFDNEIIEVLLIELDLVLRVILNKVSQCLQLVLTMPMLREFSVPHEEGELGGGLDGEDLMMRMRLLNIHKNIKTSATEN